MKINNDGKYIWSLSEIQYSEGIHSLSRSGVECPKTVRHNIA